MSIAWQDATVHCTHDATLRNFIDAFKASFAMENPTVRVSCGPVIFMSKFAIGEENLDCAMWDLLRDFEPPLIELIDRSCAHYYAVRFSFTGGFVADCTGQFDDTTTGGAAGARGSGVVAVPSAELVLLRIETDGIVHEGAEHVFALGLQSGQFDD
tara:strand:+ start:1231 stop:1698 length:468 start_codon:yes stop_codon:yes gene_type:complete